MKLCSKPSPGMITALIIGIVIALISADAFGQTPGDRANYERDESMTDVLIEIAGGSGS